MSNMRVVYYLSVWLLIIIQKKRQSKSSDGFGAVCVTGWSGSRGLCSALPRYFAGCVTLPYLTSAPGKSARFLNWWTWRLGAGEAQPYEANISGSTWSDPTLFRASDREQRVSGGIPVLGPLGPFEVSTDTRRSKPNTAFESWEGAAEWNRSNSWSCGL